MKLFKICLSLIFVLNLNKGWFYFFLKYYSIKYELSIFYISLKNKIVYDLISFKYKSDL